MGYSGFATLVSRASEVRPSAERNATRDPAQKLRSSSVRRSLRLRLISPGSSFGSRIVARAHSASKTRVNALMRRSLVRDTQKSITLELHLWSLLDHGALLADVEEGALLEAQRSGEQRRRELLDAGVV